MKHKILFVCLGNICRSPAAEGVMRAVIEKHGESANWLIDSAGTGDWHIGDLPDSRMRRAASARGINLTHRCRQLCREDFDRFDLIIGMDQSNINNIRRMAPSVEAAAKIAPIGRWLDRSTGYSIVPDPYYSTDDAFRNVLTLLENACENLYRDLAHTDDKDEKI